MYSNFLCICNPGIPSGLLLYEYIEYDEKGNWIKRIDFHKEEDPTNLVIREYEYY